MGDTGLVDKFKRVSVFLATGGQSSPDAFAPGLSRRPARALGDATINHHLPNLPLRSIISRFYALCGEEGKIIPGLFASKPFGQLFRYRMPRWASHRPQKLFLNPCHEPDKPLGHQRLASLQRIKEFFQDIQQLLAPPCQASVGVLGQEANLTGIFAVEPVIITADDTPKGLTENLLEYHAALG